MLDTQENPEHKESFVQKILHHHHNNSSNNEAQASEDKPHRDEGGLRSDLKKDEAAFKEYMKEDKKLEEEGDTYGGLA